RMPTRHELDRVSPDNPVFIPRGGHVITVNSKALELAGITKDMPNPDGGVIVRDANGEATGVLLETAAYLVRKILPPPPSNMAELLKIAMRDLNSYGIVGVIVRAYERVNNERPIRDLRGPSCTCSIPRTRRSRRWRRSASWRPCRIIPSCWATTSRHPQTAGDRLKAAVPKLQERYQTI